MGATEFEFEFEDGRSTEAACNDFVCDFDLRGMAWCTAVRHSSMQATNSWSVTYLAACEKGSLYDSALGRGDEYMEPHLQANRRRWAAEDRSKLLCWCVVCVRVCVLDHAYVHNTAHLQEQPRHRIDVFGLVQGEHG